ncbi:PREDICTED: zinc finger BED domain-containing protein 4-like [Cyphomyrmex costatus]|uniref:zinc finger BED domain-containing protein 4-like n=1 Tax=Cyphomyrmex costatus TaxID=456900 RepID=UPI0008523CC4|nr:PREDICTED: zinc finger BED domain-containing protein 4-like [Cyphomyrmex costatus]
MNSPVCVLPVSTVPSTSNVEVSVSVISSKTSKRDTEVITNNLKSQKYPADSKRAKEITESLIQMLVEDVRPFSMVEDIGFIKFVNSLNKRYKLPNRKILSTTLLTSYAQNLRDSIVEMAEIWDISTKIKVIVSDNGSNIVSAINMSPWHQISCFAHTLNLVAQSALKNTESIVNVLQKCRNIVIVFKNSNTTTELLRKATKRCMIAYEEWEMIIGIVNVLKPLYLATKEMSGEHYVTKSKVIPILGCIDSALKAFNLSNDVELLRSNLLCELDKRFGNIETNSIYAIATLLDPRFKNVVFKSKVCIKMAKTKLLCECENPYVESNNSEENTELIELNNEISNSDTDTLWATFDQTIEETGTDSISSSAKRELQRYLHSKVIHRKYNPLTWWTTEGRRNYPNLEQVALQYLCIPATSVPSERVFSKAGQILSDRRTRLQPKHVNMLTVLSANKD